jgi:hypothetical protein
VVRPVILMGLTMARPWPSKIIMSPARLLVVENQQIVAKALARRLERLGDVAVPKAIA